MSDNSQSENKSSVSSPEGQTSRMLDKENRTFSSPTPGKPRFGAFSSSSVAPTPSGSSSKVLRQHFLEASAGKQRRLHLQAGTAIRLEHGVWNRGSSRIGYDGSHKTPSKKLLRSTCASRQQRVDPEQRRLQEIADDDVDETMTVTLDLSGISLEPVSGRKNCVNPVSMTLMHGDGTEDWNMLNEIDQFDGDGASRAAESVAHSCCSSSGNNASPPPSAVHIEPPAHAARPLPQRPGRQLN